MSKVIGVPVQMHEGHAGVGMGRQWTVADCDGRLATVVARGTKGTSYL